MSIDSITCIPAFSVKARIVVNTNMLHGKVSSLHFRSLQNSSIVIERLHTLNELNIKNIRVRFRQDTTMILNSGKLSELKTDAGARHRFYYLVLSVGL